MPGFPQVVAREQHERLAGRSFLRASIIRIAARVMHDLSTHGCAASGSRSDLAHHIWTTANHDEVLRKSRDWD